MSLPRNEAKSIQNYILSTTLINISNMILFASGLTLFIIGLQYLTTYRYEYSFTIYSIDMMAGFFIAIGVVSMGLSLLALFALKPFGSPNVAILLAGWVILVFFWLFISGVVGLSLNASGQFKMEIRNNIYKTARQYENNAISRYHTRKINWLQNRFECCGIDSFTDWRTMGSGYRIGSIEFRFTFSSNNVPDTCCVQYQPGCGKNINSPDRVLQLNTKGCIGPYSRQFERDVTFVAGIATAFGSLFLFLAILLVTLAAFIRTNVNLLVQSPLARDRMETRRLNR